MNKREFLKAVINLGKKEVLEFKDRIESNSMDNHAYAIYTDGPIGGEDLTPEEIKRRDKFMEKTERENPNKIITYYGYVKLRPLKF